MVIMSDMENFCLKMACAILGAFGIGFMLAYLNLSSKGPEVVYTEPETIVRTDTIVKHDTICKYIPQKASEIEAETTSSIDSAQ